MKRTTTGHTFVEYIPELLEEGVVYVSVAYATVVHKCFCGCANEVVTPLSPTDWELTFDGETISLHPSVGSWNLDCRSHYWIRRNVVVWAPMWSREQIKAERARDKKAKTTYFGLINRGGSGDQERPRTRESILQQLRRWWSGRSIR